MPQPSVDVLIIDDDRAIQRLIADALTKHGFTVAVERDGDWALKTFEKKRFDVVILDILLPAMDGFEVAKRIRQRPEGKTVPIVMMSAIYKSPAQQKEALEKHQAIAFLEKPLKLAQLYGVLRTALGDRYPAPRELRASVSQEDKGGEAPDPDAKEEITHVEAIAAGAGAASSPESFHGAIADKPFPEVLAEVHRWKATGALLLRRDKVKKIVYFRQGTPVSVKSNLLSECLGRVLVRERMISEQDCEESVKRMKASNRQQGTVLIEMGCISPQNLIHALTVQLQIKLFELFTWERGDFQFNPKIAPPPDPVGLEESTASLIYEGIRRSFDEARLDRVFGDVQGLYVHPSENPLYALQKIDLGDEEKALLMAVDGHKTVGTLLALELLPPLEARRFLYAMKCAHMVDLKTRASEGKPKPSILKIAEDATDLDKMEVVAPVSLPPATPPVLPPTLPPRAPSAPPVAAAFPVAVAPRRGGSLLPELDGGTPPLSGEESRIRERLLRKVEELRKLDFFQVLGVAKDAKREEVKRAYFALAKEYHPDKHFGSSSAEIRQLAAQVYGLITQAHDTLTDPEERDRYVGELSAGLKREMGGEVGKILAAEGKFQKGEELLRQRLFKDALKCFSEALALYGDEGEFHAYYGWTLFQTEPANPHIIEQALRSLETAVTLNPKVDRSYLFTGYIHKATGRPDKAEKQFEKAIQCNPDCTEALRELRILGRAKQR